MPTAIKVPAGNKVFLIGHAIGVQIYSCNTRTTGSLTPAAADCNAATEGSRVEVPYTADYHFCNATGR